MPVSKKFFWWNKPLKLIETRGVQVLLLVFTKQVVEFPTDAQGSHLPC